MSVIKLHFKQILSRITYNILFIKMFYDILSSTK